MTFCGCSEIFKTLVNKMEISFSKNKQQEPKSNRLLTTFNMYCMSKLYMMWDNLTTFLLPAKMQGPTAPLGITGPPNFTVVTRDLSGTTSFPIIPKVPRM